MYKRIFFFNLYVFVCEYYYCISLDCRFMVDYFYSLFFFQGFFNVNEVVDFSFRVCYLFRFLFSFDIMYEIIVFGLNDFNFKVSDWLCFGIV